MVTDKMRSCLCGFTMSGLCEFAQRGGSSILSELTAAIVG